MAPLRGRCLPLSLGPPIKKGQKRTPKGLSINRGQRRAHTAKTRLGPPGTMRPEFFEVGFEISADLRELLQEKRRKGGDLFFPGTHLGLEPGTYASKPTAKLLVLRGRLSRPEI